jgi:hypothetical protein
MNNSRNLLILARSFAGNFSLIFRSFFAGVPVGKFAPVLAVCISLEFFPHGLLTTGSYYTKLAENMKAQLGQMSQIMGAMKR